MKICDQCKQQLIDRAPQARFCCRWCKTTYNNHKRRDLVAARPKGNSKKSKMILAGSGENFHAILEPWLRSAWVSGINQRRDAAQVKL